MADAHLAAETELVRKDESREVIMATRRLTAKAIQMELRARGLRRRAEEKAQLGRSRDPMIYEVYLRRRIFLF